MTTIARTSRRRAQRLQYVGRAHHVGGERAQRITIAFPHQWLGRQVEHDFRLGARAQRRFDVGEIAQVGARIESRDFAMRAVSNRLGVVVGSSAKPWTLARRDDAAKREPAALESRVARDAARCGPRQKSRD